MKHIKTKRRFISIVVMLSMIVTMYGFLPMPNAANAASIVDASDTLSDSDVLVMSTHTIAFTVSQDVANTDYIDVILPAPFGDVGDIGGAADVACGVGTWTNTVESTEIARCEAGALNASTTPYEIILSNIANPALIGTQVILVEHRNAADVLIEYVQLTIAIVDDVIMTAHVDATLVFTIDGMTNAETVNGENCTQDTTATTTDFGTLAPDTAEVVCQELTVATNATEGYIVTVEQDQELTSNGGDTINSFRDSIDGTGTTSPEVWVVPGDRLDIKNEYGHMGFTTDDTDLNSLGGYEDYNGVLFAGLDGTTPTVIMHHDGPADGTTQDKGIAQIAYKAEVTPLQEAGDYISTLTYIATPTY